MDYATFKSDAIKVEAIYLEAVDVLNHDVPAIAEVAQAILVELDSGVGKETLRPKAVKYFQVRSNMEDAIIKSSGELASGRPQVTLEESQRLWATYGSQLDSECPEIALRIQNLTETYFRLCSQTLTLPGMGRTSEIAALL